MSFIHLHLKSQYSLLKASIGIKGLIKKLVSEGASAVAITDENNMFGAVDFLLACNKNNKGNTMAFDKKLLEIIACPVCKGKLMYTESNNEPGLVCRYERLVYPINNGIPVLLEEKATAISLEELEALKKG